MPSSSSHQPPSRRSFESQPASSAASISSRSGFDPEPISTSYSTQPPPAPPAPPLPSSYANKASGALARFGKAIYGGSVPATAPVAAPTPVTAASSPSGSVSPRRHTHLYPPPPPAQTDEIVYKARSEIIAMGPSPTENAVAIAGKDCKY